MKIRITESQLNKVLNEVGGYDDTDVMNNHAQSIQAPLLQTLASTVEVLQSFVEMASKGKLENKPVTELIGGNIGSLKVYGSSMKRDISAIDEAERFKKLFQEKGIDAFKFRIGAECGRGLDEWDGRTEDIVKTINK